MATRSPTRSTTHTPSAGAAPLAGVFLILWIAFAAALIFSQGTLDSVWHWLGALPLVGQVAVWVLFLPLVVGLWIWESDWALWLRLVLIFMIAVGNIAAFSARPGTRAERRDGRGEHGSAAAKRGRRGSDRP
jgi:hypothetical protein